MTKRQQVELAIKDAVSAARMLIPKDTGNLRFNSFKMRREDRNTWVVYIDDEVAPYAVYVNEKWISPRWNGKENPNEGFWKKVFEFIAVRIKRLVGGQILFEYKDEEN